MEEDESLCSRIGIFMKGKLRCLGTAADLKHRLGDGFYLHVACKREEGKPADVNEAEVDSFLCSEIKGLKLLNSLNGTRNYQVSNKDTSLSVILGALMRTGDTAVAKIEDWGVENTTLEQVFVEIVKEGTLKGADEKAH